MMICFKVLHRGPLGWCLRPAGQTQASSSSICNDTSSDTFSVQIPARLSFSYLMDTHPTPMSQFLNGHNATTLFYLSCLHTRVTVFSLLMLVVSVPYKRSTTTCATSSCVTTLLLKSRGLKLCLSEILLLLSRRREYILYPKLPSAQTTSRPLHPT